MAFKIGDIVMRMDGDKRPHKIVDITAHYPLNRNEHTFFQYHYEDGGSDISDGQYIVPYDGKYKDNKVMKANEAPEKIYLQKYDENTLICLNKWNISEEWSNKPCNEKVATNIEYIRKDAFVERAAEWLDNFYNEDTNSYLIDEDIESFIDYMEGE